MMAVAFLRKPCRMITIWGEEEVHHHTEYVSEAPPLGGFCTLKQQAHAQDVCTRRLAWHCYWTSPTVPSGYHKILGGGKGCDSTLEGEDTMNKPYLENVLGQYLSHFAEYILQVSLNSGIQSGCVRSRDPINSDALNKLSSYVHISRFKSVIKLQFMLGKTRKWDSFPAICWATLVVIRASLRQC